MFLLSMGAAFYAVGSLFFVIIGTDNSTTQMLTFIIPSLIGLSYWFVSNLDPFNIFTFLDKYLLKVVEKAHKTNKVPNKKNFR